MTHVKAREWIKRLPERASDPIDAGCKGVLQAHWDHVRWDVERPATGRECWPTAETIAEEIGSTVKAVRDRISKLRAAGWMRRDGRGWALAWAVPFEVEALRGHVYAMEFSNGVVKVGRSANPTARIATHAEQATRLGLLVSRSWASCELPDCISAEKLLIRHLGEHRMPVSGSEYFVGGYDLAVTLGAAMESSPCT